jgi:hypothetical protein
MHKPKPAPRQTLGPEQVLREVEGQLHRPSARAVLAHLAREEREARQPDHEGHRAALAALGLERVVRYRRLRPAPPLRRRAARLGGRAALDLAACGVVVLSFRLSSAEPVWWASLLWSLVPGLLYFAYTAGVDRLGSWADLLRRPPPAPPPRWLRPGPRGSLRRAGHPFDAPSPTPEERAACQHPAPVVYTRSEYRAGSDGLVDHHEGTACPDCGLVFHEARAGRRP